jgi:GNAT superfamily N-acetyltransferase
MHTISLLHADDVETALPDLCEVLVDCVEGGAGVSFMSPMTHEKAAAFWRAALQSMAHGERFVLVARGAAGRIDGTVQVVLALPENQPHRGDVAKLLVHRRARHLGLAHALMREAERAAHARGKTLLVLDTVTGGAAERLYAALGWQRCGVIPGFALMPDGTPSGTTIFYKTPSP